MSCADRLAVDEPLDLEVRIVDRFDATLQVGVVAFLQILQARQRSEEDWLLLGRFNFLRLWFLVALQFLNLLQPLFIKRLQI